jgi:general secretion pathway protein K
MRARPAGAALLSALLTAALVAGLATTALWQSWQAVQRESALRQQWQTRWLMRAALDWTLAVLASDKLPAVDHLGEDWSRGLERTALNAMLLTPDGTVQAAGPAVPSPGPWLSVRISDAQARLNLLNLLEGPSLSAQWLPVFARLFDQLGLPAQELEVLGRELLRASAGTAGERPGGAALMPERAGDLLWLGLSPASVQALRPHLSVLPGRLSVNLNTAEATVLQAVLGAPPAQVQQLLDRRRARPFLSVDEALAGLQAARDMVSVQTQFFGVEIQIELGSEWQQRQSALIQRQGENLRVLWRYG